MLVLCPVPPETMRGYEKERFSFLQVYAEQRPVADVALRLADRHTAELHLFVTVPFSRSVLRALKAGLEEIEQEFKSRGVKRIMSTRYSDIDDTTLETWTKFLGMFGFRKPEVMWTTFKEIS